MSGYEGSTHGAAGQLPPVLSVNAGGNAPFVLVCDHASNRIPAPYGNLGLTLVQRLMHIAWDPGALAVALELSQLLDAPLIHSTVSRLVIDCNRYVDAIDLIPKISERTEIPGNANVRAEDRDQRIAAFHRPYHQAIDGLLARRASEGRETILVAIHSFTPVYRDVPRPWPVGLIHGADATFTAALRDALADDEPELNIGWNQPYASQSGVTYTVEHHGDGRRLATTMIEIRHDGILEPAGVSLWANRLARALSSAHERHGAPAGAVGSASAALGTA